MSWIIPLQSTIERRLLINYRLDPGVARAMVPPGLSPHLVNGYAVAGVCLIRLGSLRPAGMPAQLGWRGENAAHRIAVEWEDDDGVHAGVYIPERHSGSWIPVALGGRLVPGAHRHARFVVQETPDRTRVQMTSATTRVAADVETTRDWSSQLFPTLLDASEFFRNGSVGWSPHRHGSSLEGLRLETANWRVNPGRARSVASSFFDGLPVGAATLDSVLIMRDVMATWTPSGAQAPALTPAGGAVKAVGQESTHP